MVQYLEPTPRYQAVQATLVPYPTFELGDPSDMNYMLAGDMAEVDKSNYEQIRTYVKTRRFHFDAH